MEFNPLTSTTRPATDSVVTVRIIKSFPFRNVRNVVLTGVDLTQTPRHLYDVVMAKIATDGALRPYRNVAYDTLKVYSHAHGTKTMNLVVNLDHDDWVLPIDGGRSLEALGVCNEDEISLYRQVDYDEYKSGDHAAKDGLY